MLKKILPLLLGLFVFACTQHQENSQTNVNTPDAIKSTHPNYWVNFNTFIEITCGNDIVVVAKKKSDLTVGGEGSHSNSISYKRVINQTLSNLALRIGGVTKAIIPNHGEFQLEDGISLDDISDGLRIIERNETTIELFAF